MNASPEIDWLSSVLWDNVAVAPGEGRYGVLPSRRRPRLLVPLDSRRAGAASLSGYASSRWRSRIGARALAAGVRAGLGPLLMRGRAGPAAGEDDRHLFERHLDALMGRPVHMSVFFQAGRPQKKPVLALFAGDGTRLGFGKVGWNDLTSRLVRAEGDALALLSRLLSDQCAFLAPPVLHAGHWRGRELLVVGAVPGVATRPPEGLPLAATRELAVLRPGGTAPLAASGYWRGQVERAARLGQPLPPALLALIERSRHAAVPVAFGIGHGDWVPWNMGRTASGQLLVWDWEWCRSDVPVGLDAVQWLFQVELNRDHRPPSDAVDRTLRAARHQLPELSVDGRLAAPLLAAHLVEAMLRLAEARAGGVGAVISASRYEDAAGRLTAIEA